MTHAVAIADIKRTAGRIKTLLDNPDMDKRHAGIAVYNANAQLNRIQTELGVLESALQQHVSAERTAVKVGPSETKAN